MQQRTRNIGLAVTLAIAASFAIYLNWPAGARGALAGVPCTVVCETCGTYETTWDQAMKRSGRDASGMFTLCEKCDRIARPIDRASAAPGKNPE